jgi:hypothetical protein
VVIAGVIKDPFTAPGSTLSYVCLPPTWGSEDGDCLIVRFLWDYHGPQEIYRKKVAKATKSRTVIQAFQLTFLFVEVPHGNRKNLTQPL